MVELEQTLTPNFAARGLISNRREDFEQKLTKGTKGRNSQETFVSRLSGVRRPPAERVDQVGQVHTCKNAMKQGTWPTLPTFFGRCNERFVGVLVGGAETARE